MENGKYNTRKKEKKGKGGDERREGKIWNGKRRMGNITQGRMKKRKSRRRQKRRRRINMELEYNCNQGNYLSRE